MHFSDALHIQKRADNLNHPPPGEIHPQELVLADKLDRGVLEPDEGRQVIATGQTRNFDTTNSLYLWGSSVDAERLLVKPMNADKE